MSSMKPTLLFLKKNLRRSVEDSTPLCRNDEDSAQLSHHHRLHNNDRMMISNINVQEFKLGELVASIENGFVVIKGSHGEKRDKYGLTSRMFSRRVAIPRGVIENEIKVKLFSNGMLSVTGKKRSEILDVPIQKISLAALKEGIDRPVFHRLLNRQRPAMFNPSYLRFLEISKKSKLTDIEKFIRKNTILNRSLKIRSARN